MMGTHRRTFDQAAILAHIQAKGEVTVNSIAGAAGLGAASGSGHKGLLVALHQLEREGLIKARSVPYGAGTRRLWSAA